MSAKERSDAAKRAWDTIRRNRATQLLNSKEVLESLKLVQASRIHDGYVKGLERHVGSIRAGWDKLYHDIASKISGIRVNSVVLDAAATKRFLEARTGGERPSGERRSVCTIWSDHHFGANVDPEEMGNGNRYDWEIAARRLGMICEETATYKESRRKYHDELVIFLLGDSIGGIIHNQEGPSYDLMINQIIGATEYYIQAINYLKARGLYPKVRVYCQPGNHGRVQHKADKSRALVNKYDSLENIVFYNLALAFRGDPRVEIHVPKAPFCDVEVQGHRVYGTHGDTVFTTGNVGHAINTKAIEQKVANINAMERDKGKKPFSLFLAAHGHRSATTSTSNGVHVVINGCLIGLDSYGQGLGIPDTRPSQHLWEMTPKFAFGDNRFLEVQSADGEKDFEKIIRPYKGAIE
jgi:hypothetical protein